MKSSEMASGEAVAEGVASERGGIRRPQPLNDGETILWQGRPNLGMHRLLEMVGLILLLLLLSWLALELIRPHMAGSRFAGNPEPSALPLILGMVFGMMLIIALPVWLRSSARARSRYMLTNRRALVWLGNRIVGEAILFGCQMEQFQHEVSFRNPGLWLDWRLKDEGPDRVRFEQLADVAHVAELAEAQGARRVEETDKD